MSGQGRKIYLVFLADAIGSDNIIAIEGNNVRVGAWTGSGNMDYEGLLDEVRFYKRSFTDNDISILYGSGNGDLGLTPVITLDHKNSASTVSGTIEFLKFGQPQSTSGLNPSDIEVDGGTINNVVNNGTGYDFDFAPSGHPSTARISLPAGSISSGDPSRELSLNLF